MLSAVGVNPGNYQYKNGSTFWRKEYKLMPYNEKEFGKNQTLCTQKQIRTATPLPAPPPQDGASTNFATWVFI